MLAFVVQAFAVVVGEFVVVGDLAIVVFDVVSGGREAEAFWKRTSAREFNRCASRLFIGAFSSSAV